LRPLQRLVRDQRGRRLPLPPRLVRLYGDLYLPVARSRPYVFSNFVTTLDGVVSLHARGHATGADISGFSARDRMVMGLLRAVADVVVVGSGTLAADPSHVWTPEAICPELGADYGRFRAALGKPGAPLNVIVSGSGALDLRLPVFASGQVQVLILTTSGGARRLARQSLPAAARIRAIHRGAGQIPAHAILRAVLPAQRGRRVLVEGGPRLLADFYRQRLIDELFLTLSAQIAGREEGDGRPSMVMGAHFAPSEPLWGSLCDARRGGDQLFLRYALKTAGVSFSDQSVGHGSKGRASTDHP
jgi:riboflavin biosynthesis pyrimidine reductase